MTDATGQRVIVVLGMHRSGTSAMSRVVNLLGAQISSNLLPPQPDNPLGYWEPLELVRLNDRFLSTAGSSWDDIRPLRAGWLNPAARRNEIENAVEFLTEDFSEAPLFSVKDPRLSRSLLIWLAAFKRLGIEPFFVIACRNPLAVCKSLLARNNFSIGYGQLLWLRYMLEAETATRGQRRIIVHYEKLLKDWRCALATILEQMALWRVAPNGHEAKIDNFLDIDEQHHTGSIEALLANDQFSDLTKDTYVAFETATNLDLPLCQERFCELNERLGSIFDACFPPDFDAERYLDLHEDVAKSNIDPAYHYLTWGVKEGRAYK